MGPLKSCRSWLQSPLSLLALPLAAHTSPLTVTTTSGTVQGYSPHDSVNAFLGIPYAQPPVGPMRFKPPQPFENKSNTIIDGSVFGKSCFQFVYKTPIVDRGGPLTGESEDCLTLNIWVPQGGNTTGLLPTLVWIHGGGFVSGSSSISMYDPVGLLRAHQDIIVVTLNWRQNIFGFPNTPALAPDGLNLGLRDVRFAIEWLQGNLPAFGGDGAKMTLFGQSAGSMVISLYAFSHADNPIVRGLIMQSGQPEGIPRDYGLDVPKVANITGCTNVDKVKELDCLRKVDAVELKRAISPYILNSYGSLSGGTPVEDNVTLLTRPEYIIRGAAGRFAKIPILLGNTNDEGTFLVPFSAQGVNRTFADQITEFSFHCPVVQAAKYRVDNNVPVWRYRYRATFPSVSPFPWTGSYHSAELPIVFGTIRTIQYRDPQPYEIEASNYMQSAWVAFAKDPQQGLTEFGWPRYNPTQNTLIELFVNNTSNATFSNPAAYDESCSAIQIPDGTQYKEFCL